MSSQQLPPAWIVQYSPDEQNYEAAFQYLNTVTIPVDEYQLEIQPEDTIYLWQVANPGVDGIVAVCRVRSAAVMREPLDAEKPFVAASLWRTTRVVATVERVLRQPYTRTELLEHSWTKRGEFFTAPGRRTYRLRPQEERSLRTHTVGDMAAVIDLRITPDLPAQRWHECMENGYLSITWDQSGDLRAFTSPDHLFVTLQEREPGIDPASLVQKVRDLWVLRLLRPGDRIYVTEGRERVRGWGEVTTPWYEWKNGRHAVNMSWHELDFWVEAMDSWAPGSIGQMELDTHQLTQAVAEDYATKAEVRETHLKLRLQDYWRERLSRDTLGQAAVELHRLVTATRVVFGIAYGHLTPHLCSSLIQGLENSSFDLALEKVYCICLDDDFHEPAVWHDTAGLERILRAKTKQITGMTVRKLLPKLDPA